MFELRSGNQCLRGHKKQRGNQFWWFCRCCSVLIYMHGSRYLLRGELKNLELDSPGIIISPYVSDQTTYQKTRKNRINNVSIKEMDRALP